MPVKRLFAEAKARGLLALGLTDTANLFGAMEFCLEAKKTGIKPILGTLLPVTLAQAGGTSVEPSSESFQLPLFVQNAAGYKNLCQLITKLTLATGDEKGPSGTVALAGLKGKTEGLIAFDGGLKSPLYALLGDAAGAEKAADHLKTMETLFQDRLYIEVERYPDPSPYEARLIDLAFQKSLPLVATCEAFFKDADDHAAHDALLCIKDTTYVAEGQRRRETPHHRFKTADQMAALFADLPEALANTVQVAMRCSFMLRAQKPMLPSFETKKGQNQEELLREKAEAGLKYRLDQRLPKDLSPDQRAAAEKPYKERMEYELGVILGMKFAGYFLIVTDFIQWSKSQGISVGPGRGSGAGSVVAWSLLITGLDPLKFGLLFERFLNPERISMPDFDIDFCPERRDEVIQYVQQKYGADSVAHIITFGKLQARAVLRDVGRVLGMPYGQVDKIAKRIPFNPANPVTLDQAVEADEELQEMQKTDATVGQLFDYALRLEGLYRHASTHAAGVVIADRPLTDFMPLYQDPKSTLPATQFSMNYVEAIGLVKFDFLGLKTLTVLEEAAALANKQRQKAGQSVLDLETLPLDDKVTFDLLKTGHVMGLFQLESGGMRDVLMQLQPDVFAEIVALGALYRPGPMDNIPYYLACKHGREKVVYAYDCLEGVLKETFGVMVYQEQVLKTAQVLAGYSLGQADILRKAMGKKIKEEMDTQRKAFVAGVIKNVGGAEEKAAALFDQIAKFAGYAFNKAHATAYGLITYQTAYMKANYPLAFMVASLNQDRGNTDRLALFVRDLKNVNLAILPPDINKSDARFKAEVLEASAKTRFSGGIRYGLCALKNVGEGAMEAVQAERQAGGPFKCIFDFVERLGPKRILNKRQFEHLIWAGAFDTLEANRTLLFHNAEVLLSYGQSCGGEAGLFSLDQSRPDLKPTPEVPRAQRLEEECAALGFYLSGHPVSPYAGLLKQAGVTLSKDLEGLLTKTGSATAAGVLLSSKVKVGKSGKKYAFLTLSDETGIFEAMMFEDLLLSWRPKLSAGRLFVLEIQGRTVGDSMRFSVAGISPIEDALQKWVPFSVRIDNEAQVDALKNAFVPDEGQEAAARPAPLAIQMTQKCPPDADNTFFEPGQTYEIKATWPDAPAVTPPVVERLYAAGVDLWCTPNKRTMGPGFKDVA